MGDLYFKEGNILDCEETVLCHQCNCVSKNSAGLAKQIYDKWERANVYKLDRGNELAGSILFSNNIPSISYNGDDIEIIPTHGPIICNMFAQIYPGRPRWGIDSKENRLKYFRTCLKSLIEYHFADYTGSGIANGQENINNTYAFPYKIGCSFARGSWDQYLKQIEKFAKKISTHVTIYRI